MSLEPTGAAGVSINLSLVSHTNAGKTTLARTLLGRDVGVVRDAAHVTDVASAHVMVQAGEDRLTLWDTPGFGDTARLLRRLRMSSNPLGWLITQVWDRWRERPLWSSQQAVRNARDHADVILYLVNAAEDPADAGYVALEMELLAWIAKPVVLLLNQMGPPRADAELEEARWRDHLAEHAVVRGVLTLDAFARCWVQEGTLLRTLAPLVAPEKQAALGRLAEAWRTTNVARFERSMGVLAEQLALAAGDAEALGDLSWRDKFDGAFSSLQKQERPKVQRAMAALAERRAAAVRASTEQLLALHGLSGRAAREVMQRAQGDFATKVPVETGVAAVVGGVVSGAVTGLAADLMAGGLTLGAGMVVGGVLGALGAGGAVQGYKMVKGEQQAAVRWSEPVLRAFVEEALLRYLAVAHFGRGRGDYAESEHPAFWREAVAAVVAAEGPAIGGLWREAPAGETDRAARIEPVLRRCGAELLGRLYPEARSLLQGQGGELRPLGAL